MPLPNPGMDFTPFDILTAAEMDDLVENIESLADGSGFDAGAIGSEDLADDVDPQTIGSETMFDHVASGCVITGTGYGSTLGWSMTAGVVYIGGRRLTVSSATGTVTASRDTYFDLLYPGSGTVATLVNTAGNIVTNNAASPALAANSVRIGIVVSGASNIASVASINQGQETKVLPIASSVPYQVTDSLGNLICPRDPNRKLLGYRQILSTFSTASATDVQITGLSCPVIVPSGRKVKVTITSGRFFNSAANANIVAGIWDGTVGSGTNIGQSITTSSSSNYASPGYAEALVTPSATSKTYNASALASGGGTSSFYASSVSPGSIKVELE